MRPKPAPALSEAEQRLRAIISKAPVVLFAADANGIVTLCEGKALQKLGKVSGQSVGQSLFDMYRSYPAVIANVRRALAGEAFSSLDELTGLGLCFEIHWAPIRAENGIPAGTIAVAVDVSERTRDERAREEAETLYRSLVEQLAAVTYIAIFACSIPQNSAHCPRKVPGRSACIQIAVTYPGTRSRLPCRLGAQKLWITSCEPTLKTTGRPVGT